MDADGDLCFAIDDDTDWTTPDDSACTTDANYDDNKWHFVSGVKDSTNSIKLYVDGLEKASDTSLTATGTLVNGGPLEVGIDSDTSSNPWVGYLDEVKIYRDNTARTAAQVAADYNSRSTDKGVSFAAGSLNNPNALSNDLVGYWKEDETSDGAAATDSSGNSITLIDSGTSIVRALGKYFMGADFESGSTHFQSVADSDYPILSITGSLTISTWIKPETVSAGSYNIVAKWDGADESYRLFQNADEVRLELDSAGNYVETSSSNLSAGTWYHVVGVYDSSKATAKIYINGVEATTTTTGTIPASIGNDGSRFHLGAEDGGGR